MNYKTVVAPDGPKYYCWRVHPLQNRNHGPVIKYYLTTEQLKKYNDIKPYNGKIDTFMDIYNLKRENRLNGHI